MVKIGDRVWPTKLATEIYFDLTFGKAYEVRQEMVDDAGVYIEIIDDSGTPVELDPDEYLARIDS